MRNPKPAATVEFQECVRHRKQRKDARLRYFFLCNKCSKKWVEEAFNGNKPLYIGNSLRGYCMLCNSVRTVRLRTWFLCDICYRVANSIGKNHVAEKAILDFWRADVQTKFPRLTIKQKDKSSLRRRLDTDKAGKGQIDFHIFENRKLVFGIENKAGRSSLREMSQFQLDISDCNSIQYNSKELNIPVYIIHAKVLEIWKPPTYGFKCHGLWWSDIFRMRTIFIRSG